MLDPELQQRGVALSVSDRRQERQDTGLVVLMDQVDEPRPFKLLGSGSEQARRGRARVPDQGGRLDHRHDVRRVLDERREPRLALAQQQILGEAALSSASATCEESARRLSATETGISSSVAITIMPRNPRA
jgi:hypothetical protein